MKNIKNKVKKALAAVLACAAVTAPAAGVAVTAAVPVAAHSYYSYKPTYNQSAWGRIPGSRTYYSYYVGRINSVSVISGRSVVSISKVGQNRVSIKAKKHGTAKFVVRGETSRYYYNKTVTVVY